MHGSLRVKYLEGGARRTETELMWNDPAGRNGLHASRRGIGHLFGADITRTLCDSLGIRAICRSHEPAKAIDAPYVEHSGRIVTTSSTRAYRGRAFVIIVDPNAISDASTLRDAAVEL